MIPQKRSNAVETPPVHMENVKFQQLIPVGITRGLTELLPIGYLALVIMFMHQILFHTNVKSSLLTFLFMG